MVSSGVPKASPVKVGLLAASNSEFGRCVVRGAAHWAESRPNWHYRLVDLRRAPLDAIRRGGFDALLGQIWPHVGKHLDELGLPTLDCTGMVSHRWPVLSVDHAAIGTLAARHLFEYGHRSFGFVGLRDNPLSQRTEQGFHDTVRDLYAAGDDPAHTLSVAKPHLLSGDAGELDELTAWLRALPKPVGVMVFDDVHAFEVNEACSVAGLHVPKQIAIISAGNDPLLCSLSDPPLTSIRLPGLRLGYEAASRLERLLAGQDVPSDRQFPVAEITPRASTNPFALAAPQVSAAAQFMMNHYHKPIGVEDVLDHVGVSRRWIERQFVHHAGCTPAVYLNRIRVDRIAEHLADSDLTLSQIAARVGLGSPGRVCTVFKRIRGQSPGAYRAQFRAG